MKKNIILIIGIVVLLILLILSFNIKDKNYAESVDYDILSNDAETVMANAKRQSEEAKKKKQKDLKEISAEELVSRYNANDYFLVFIGSETCKYSQIAEPIIKDIVQQYDIELYYLDVGKLTEEDDEKLSQTDELFSSDFGTPLLILIKNNSIPEKVNGMTDKAHYINFFKINGYIVKE